ncbi:MAG: hypothetical protein KDA84_04430, partial [Planctomycetaceae bacterium]|nr:hypothetical protein [Planctomycetaceae bacterium]
MHSKRIAITGIGVVSPLGQEPAEFWRHLLEDSDRMSEVVPQRMGQASFQGMIDDFGDVPQYLDRPIRKALKLMNRETQMGVVAGERALLESEVTTHYDPERIGVCFGADNVSIKPEDFQSGVAACTNSEGAFELGAWGTQGLTEVAPLWLLKCLPNMAACHLGILNDLRGPSNTITQRDVAANLAIAEACRIIKDDDADAMVVGASGTSLPVFNLMHARLEEEVSQDSTVFCSPFDKRHTGLAPGEGAAALVLEDLSSALSRGAEIYGEILGMGSASVIGHDGAACGRALVRAMRQMFRQVRVAPESIGHIHAHGLGT